MKIDVIVNGVSQCIVVKEGYTFGIDSLIILQHDKVGIIKDFNYKDRFLTLIVELLEKIV